MTTIKRVLKPGWFIPSSLQKNFETPVDVDDLPEPFQQVVGLYNRVCLDPEHRLDAMDMVEYQRMIPKAFMLFGRTMGSQNNPESFYLVADQLLDYMADKFIADPRTFIPPYPKDIPREVAAKFCQGFYQKIKALFPNFGYPNDGSVFSNFLINYAGQVVKADTSDKIIRMICFAYTFISIQYSLDVPRQYGEDPHN